MQDEDTHQNNNIKTERNTKRKGKKRKHPDAMLIENSKVATSESDESETSSSRPSSPC